MRDLPWSASGNGCMGWSDLGQWEWAVGEAIVLPLLFFELYRVRRSQRRDREKAATDFPGSRDIVTPDTKRIAQASRPCRLRGMRR